MFQILCDEEWSLLQSLLPKDPEKRGRGMPHANFRFVLNTIFWILFIWILFTGARWKDVPKNTNFAAKSTAHRWLKKWQKEGVFDQMLIQLLKKSTKKTH